ncbi:dienelactone hydrolase family protein [Shumkonia mesophila]|uniref:dienelactone hydrolase family protein n=1 Tax=Shumkonia mesophila TaxID=2838854 RepID=UPI002934A5AC|nr:dienelactone hydrolase family protein [Shumkonia mesophila]
MAARWTGALLVMLSLLGTAAAEETVRFPSLDADLTGGAPTELSAVLFRPAGAGPFPAVVMLHGCGGMWTSSGKLGTRDRDWADRLAAADFTALLVDSLTPRGLGSLCRMKERPISPSRERARDAHGALAWLAQQSWARADRIAVIGWSNGGSTVLSTVDRAAPGRPMKSGPDFRLAVAFYPGCSTSARSSRWRNRLPLTVLIGEADDWTPAAPCRDLAARAAKRAKPGNALLDLVVYPGAYHDFDHPKLTLRLHAGLSATADGSGNAHTGTDPAARADAIARVMALLAPLKTE